MMLKKLLHSCSTEQTTEILTSAADIDANSWESVVGSSAVYLQLQYLQALESSLETIEFNYVILRNTSGEAICVAYFQIIEFNNLDKVYKEWLRNNYGEQLFNKIIPSVDLKILICGNLFVCGEHGFAFTNEISEEKARSLVAESMETAAKQMGSGEGANIFLVKELYPESDPNFNAFQESNFIPFQIDCNMVLRINPSWRDSEDYYQCMQSKYRTKAKATFKRSSELMVQELFSEDIKQNLDRIDELHQQVVDQAEFSLGELNAKAFLALKESIGDSLKFTAYKLKEELIGFSIAIEGKDFLDATHVGIDYKYNTSYGLYQRMLHDYVELAIRRKKPELRLGRTAEQVKSTLGAEPVNMRLYLRHKHNVVNHLLKPLVEKIQPSNFELRKPFKAKYYEEWTH